jgi:uncharacterized caspase-like protein
MKKSRIKIIGALASTIAIALAFAGCSNITASGAAANRYAIVIGVQDYPVDGTYSNDLNYPDDDADDMATLLTAKGWTVVKRLISSSDSTISTDGLPTYDSIEKTFTELGTKVSINSDSTVLVYYSGHGSTNDDHTIAYVIPYDGIVEATATIDGQPVTYTAFDTSKWISAARMSNWLGALSCKNKILILDSCYSGGFVDTGSSTDAIPSSYGLLEGGVEAGFLNTVFGNFGSLLQKSVSDKGDPDVLTITAAGSNEPSWDDGNHLHGAFTYYLLQAASSGDSDGDGYVTATEAYSYAKKKVKAVWDADYTTNLDSWQSYYNSYGYVPDFLPHISGGTGELVLYDNN